MPTDFDKIDWDSMVKYGSTNLAPGVMDSASKEEPDTYAKNLQLANDTGADVDAVANDPVAFKSKLDFDKIDWDAMSVRSPLTTDYLSTFDNAVLAQDDIPLLERLESIISSNDIVTTGAARVAAFYAGDPFSKEALDGLGETIGLSYQQLVKSAALGAVDAGASVIANLIPRGSLPLGFTEMERQLMSRDVASAFGVTTDEELAGVKETLVQDLIDDIIAIEEKKEALTPEGLNLAQKGVRAGLESLGVMAPGFALMMLTGSPAAMLIPMGVQTGFTSFGTGRAEGLSPGEATAFGLIDGSIEVLTEMLPTRTLQRILTGSTKGTLSRQAAKFLIQEMGTEQLALFGQTLNSYLFGLDEQLNNAESFAEVTEIMVERMAVTGIATVVAGGAQAGVVTGIRAAIDSTITEQQKKDRASAQEQGVLNELNNIAENSNLRQRSPQAFSRFIEDIDVENKTDVFIDGPQVTLYLQENADKIDDDPALQLLAQASKDSAISGEDVAIPIQDFTTVIAGTEHFEALRDSMVLNQDTVSPFRQESANKETENFIAKMVAEAQENVTEYVEAQNIFLQVRGQLIDTGQVNARSADVMAQLVPAWATVFAKRNNISVKEAFEQSGLAIEGPQTGEKARLEEESKTVFQRVKETLFPAPVAPVEKVVFTGPVTPGGIEAQQIIDSVKETGGITLTQSGQVLEADTGFIVSVRSMDVDNIAHAPNLVRTVLQSLKGVQRSDFVVGVFDMGDGRFSIDTNIVTQTRDEAIALAKEFDQQSVYDLAAGAVIETGGTGKGATEEKFQAFLQRERVPDTDGLNSEGVIDQPPVTKGVITLDHFSKVSGIEVLDPTKSGTGIRATEERRSKDEFWVDRTNHGIATGENGGYRKEVALGNVRYRTQVAAGSLYDIQEDPQNFKADRGEAQNPNERLNLLEKRIKEAGYVGYWSNNPAHGLVAVTFGPIETAQTGRVYSQPPVHNTGAKNQTEFAQAMDELIVEEHGRNLGEKTEVNKGIISDTLVAEVIEEVGENSSAADWYKESIQAALGYAAVIHPQIATDENERQLFIMIMALTSNGATIARNVDNAEKIYAHYSETAAVSDNGIGELSLDAGGAYGLRGPVIGRGLDKLSGLVNELGLEGAFEFLNKTFTAKELRGLGFTVTGENNDTMVHGSAIFGPKIGGAYFQNLRGNWDVLTMDQWFMKTWGRVTGTGVVNGEMVATPENGGNRNWIREVLTEVQSKLANKGVELDTATIQALLWYREKDLYTVNGVITEKGEATDYEQEFYKLVEARLGSGTPALGGGLTAGGARSTARERAQVRRDQAAPILAQGKDRGYYDSTNTLIRLTQAADLSTFTHEFAHFILDQEVKSDGSLLPEISKWFSRNAAAVALEATSYQKDTTAIITEEDVISFLDNDTTGDTAKDKHLTRAVHEQFARGFEQYLMEGKSPSVELGKVFRTIARWMQRIYASIRTILDVAVDDQMRQVFDRLLATEEQIASASARVQAVQMFATAEEANMTPEQFKEYQDQADASEDTAHEKLRNKLIAQLRRRATKEWNEEKADIAATLKAELEKTKVYLTINALRKSEDSVKLDRAAVKEMVGQEVTSKLGTTFIKMPPQVRNMTVTGGKGLHPDEAAALFGYGSGSEMLADIILADPIDKVSEEAAEIAMQEKHGDILNDGTIEAEADAAVQNEERAKLLLMELKALSRGTTVPSIDREVLEQIARKQIDKLAYRNIHPGKYRRAELDAKGQAEVALSKGNNEEAATAKMRQLLNFYLGRAATEARTDTLKIVDRMSRYNKKAVQERIVRAQNGYWEQIVKILERFEFRKSATLKSVNELNESVNVWMMDRIEQDGDALILSAAVLDESYVTHWKNIRHEDLKGISESVGNIEHVARYSDEMNILQEKITFQKLVNDWTAHMAQANTTKFKPERTTVVEKTKFAAIAMAQMTKIPWLATWLDGGERVGLTHDILVQPFTDALDAEFKLYNETVTVVVDAMKNRSRADLRRHNSKIFIPEIKNDNNDGNLMGHQVLAVALNTGNESNLRKLLLGEGWANPENEAEITFENPQLQAVLAHMSKSDWNLVQLIWDQMDTLFPQLSEVHRKTTGESPPKIEATSISTPFGEFGGGYYPIKYDAVRSQKAFVNEERADAQTESMFSTIGSIHASVNTSATNARTGFYDPIRLSLDVVPNHFQETIHFITHHDAVRQVNKLLNSKQVRDVISAKLGPAEFAQLKPWLNDIAKDGRASPNKNFIDAVFGRLRFGATLTIMGFKASVGIIQLSGLSNSIGEIGTANMAQGMRLVLGSPKKINAAWEYARDHSKVMAHRIKTMDREMMNAFNVLEKKSGFLAAVQEASMKHIAYTQLFAVDLPSWHGARIKELGISGDEAKAERYADFVIEQVQGSGNIKDMAAVMRNQSKTHRIFTMFMTFFSSLWNTNRDIARGARGKQYSTTTVAAKIMFTTTIPILFEMVMRGQLFKGGDDEDELNMQQVLTNMALFPIQSIPLLRDVASGVSGDFGYNISPVASVIEKGVEGFRQIAIRGVTDAEITSGQIKNATKLAGAFLGVPGVNQVWATSEHLFEVIENGEEFTTREFLFGPDR